MFNSLSEGLGFRNKVSEPDLVNRELNQLGFDYGIENNDSFMYGKRKYFKGNKIIAHAFLFNDFVRVIMGINSYPSLSQTSFGFSFLKDIPVDKAAVCKAYLQDLLSDVKNSIAYKNNLEPLNVNKGVGVIILQDGEILVGERTDGRGLCGPGGSIKDGEDIKQAASREAYEEFGIIPKNLKYLGEVSNSHDGISYIFIANSYKGSISIAKDEMKNYSWLSIDELKHENLLEAFKNSLSLLKENLDGNF